MFLLLNGFFSLDCLVPGTLVTIKLCATALFFFVCFYRCWCCRWPIGSRIRAIRQRAFHLYDCTEIELTILPPSHSQRDGFVFVAYPKQTFFVYSIFIFGRRRAGQDWLVFVLFSSSCDRPIITF